MLDEIYLYLHALIQLGQNEEYREKVCRILREYESVLTSLMPQLCYNKLRYISILSQLYNLTGSDCVKTHIKAISITIKSEEIINDLKVKDLRNQEGFLFRWFILQNICKNNFIEEDIKHLLNECYSEKKDAICDALTALINQAKEDAQFKKLLRIKEFVKLGNEMFLITEGRNYF